MSHDTLPVRPNSLRGRLQPERPLLVLTEVKFLMRIYHWSEIEREQMTAGITRQVIHSERMTVARISLPKGAVVPRHHHENEQITLLQEGRLRFVFPERDMVLSAGEAMQIPPNVPHEVEALEDSLAVDLFAPVREDWIRGDDAYLRGR